MRAKERGKRCRVGERERDRREIKGGWRLRPSEVSRFSWWEIMVRWRECGESE